MPSTYEKIATYTAPSSQASYTFSSIPSTYTDLVLITDVKYATALDASLLLTFNGDTTTNYSATNIAGDGSTATSGRRTSVNSIEFARASNTVSTTGITHIFNYANTTTFKTILSRGGTSNVVVVGWVGLWRKTPEGITSMTITGASGVYFATGSTFNLYGIKAA